MLKMWSAPTFVKSPETTSWGLTRPKKLVYWTNCPALAKKKEIKGMGLGPTHC